ncbi:MAG: prolyl oligopeptidase family serine peptidase [Bacteroidales bacterium]|nr:prolyl oligopeptidase family serine peptidase [Bacteroidales bacterium]
MHPGAAGRAYWQAGEEYVIISDGYDLYRFPVKGGKSECLTLNGRKENIRYTLNELDEETRGKQVDVAQSHILTGFNTVDRTSGYYKVKNLLKPSKPVVLAWGKCRYASLNKAQDASVLTFTQQSFEQMPDIWRTDLNFRKPMQLTRMVDQQKQFIWGSPELIHWTSYKGVQLDGVIYKPANFDPTKKYPLIVNFYERNADELYSARVPNPGRSTPDYHMYLSQGYVIFNPDVRYTTGHPGESCYDCVMSGIDSVCALGFIDESRIGATGHSWGGYQVAYLATRTNRFAAIESGAPVVNMFSAYGGIRWATGRARAFQYEHTQSRLGTTMWENPEIYAENSPLMQMHKVTTPILIMANDTDGHVPYTQGIEMFVAMKRLNKPAWLLNYTGEPHWPCMTSNRVDFQIRLLQFFNHYLKGEPMPTWMSEGIRAVDQPYELGY